MKLLSTILLALTTATAALAQETTAPMSDGTITRIDAKWNKLTIDHGPLLNLGMDAMKMVFDLADPAMIEGLSEGQKISFLADRINGKLTVVEIRAE